MFKQLPLKLKINNNNKKQKTKKSQTKSFFSEPSPLGKYWCSTISWSQEFYLWTLLHYWECDFHYHFGGNTFPQAKTSLKWLFESIRKWILFTEILFSPFLRLPMLLRFKAILQKINKSPLFLSKWWLCLAGFYCSNAVQQSNPKS